MARKKKASMKAVSAVLKEVWTPSIIVHMPYVRGDGSYGTGILLHKHGKTMLYKDATTEWIFLAHENRTYRFSPDLLGSATLWYDKACAGVKVEHYLRASSIRKPPLYF